MGGYIIPPTTLTGVMLLSCCYVTSIVSDSALSHRQQSTRLPRPWDSPGKNAGVGCHFLLQCMKVQSESEVTQSCPTLSDPMDCSLPGSSVHGIFQARVLEWGAIAFSMSPFGNCVIFEFFKTAKDILYCWLSTRETKGLYTGDYTLLMKRMKEDTDKWKDICVHE